MIQLNLFACACGEVHLPHFLPNYDPPEWVIGRPPQCGKSVYGPTREAVLILAEGPGAKRPEQSPLERLAEPEREAA